MREGPEASGAGRAIYHYRVFNNGPRPITAFYIGYDYFHGVAELGAVPTGWTFETGIPAAKVTSKPGWEPLLTTQEEREVHWISWSGAATPIPPGGVGGEFSIRLPQADATHETGHWTARFNDSTVASGQLELDDNLPAPDGTAPSLNVTLSPSTVWPPNRKMVEITATITVSDDHDPSPIVRLVSITSNETLAATTSPAPQSTPTIANSAYGPREQGSRKKEPVRRDVSRNGCRRKRPRRNGDRDHSARPAKVIWSAQAGTAGVRSAPTEP